MTQPQSMRERIDSQLFDKEIASNSDVDRLEMIRELLLGDVRRASEARMAELESRLKALENSLTRRLESLEKRVDDISRSNEERTRQTLDEVSRGMAEMSSRLQLLRQRGGS